MKIQSSISLLILLTCHSLVGLLSAHGLGEQTFIKTPHGCKTIETISKRVSKNKKIISYSEKKQRNLTSEVRKAGKSDTNCHIRITLYNTTPSQPDEILCTPTQEFYVPATNSWVPAYSLRVGDKLKSNLHGTATIAQHNFIQKPLSVYMLEVEKYHNFFVGKQEILTHNTALPWQVAIWVCIPFGEAAMGAQAGGCFGPVGIMGGAVIGSAIGYGLRCVADYDKVHEYDSFFNLGSLDDLIKKSLNLSKPAATPPPSEGSGTPEEPSSADKPETTCPIEKIMKRLTKAPHEKSRKPNFPSHSDIYEKPEGDSFKDWQQLPLNDRRTKPKNDGTVVHIGTLPDGRVVISRETSDDGRSTLEIQDHKTKKITKIRYGTK